MFLFRSFNVTVLYRFDYCLFNHLKILLHCQQNDGNAEKQTEGVHSGKPIRVKE